MEGITIEGVRTSPEIGELAKALAAAQAAAQHAEKSRSAEITKGGKTRQYATMADVLNAARPALAANGLSITQLPTGGHGGTISITSILMHSSGQWIASTMQADFAAGQAMSEVQALGTVITYLRRYAYSAIAGVAPADDEDDDGEGMKGANLPARKSDGLTLPPFGSAKGQPIAGQPLETLESYRGALLRSVADPDKARFKDANQALVTAIEKEMEAQRTAKAAPPKLTPEQVKAENDAMEARKAKVKVAAEALAKECGVDVSEVGKALRAKGITSMGEMTPDSWTAFEKEFRAAHGLYIKALNLTREAGLFMQTLEEWCVGNGIKTPAQFTAEHLASWTARVAEETAAREPGAQG